MKKIVLATQICDLTESLQGRHCHGISIGAKRDVLMLSLHEPVHRDKPMLRGVERQYRLHHWQDNVVKKVDSQPTMHIFYEAQVLGNNYLLKAAETQQKSDNILVISGSGEFVNSWYGGYAINTIQVTNDGRIWVAYGDEGCFSGQKLLAQQGLVCFNSQGQRIFGFQDDVVRHRQDLEFICDCYAINVVSDADLWLCYYQEFPRVHLRDYQVQTIHQAPREMVGSHGFAVCGARFLFTGGYYNRHQLFWRDEDSQSQTEIEAVDQNGNKLQWDHVQGRGADLFLSQGSKVWMLSLNELDL